MDNKSKKIIWILATILGIIVAGFIGHLVFPKTKVETITIYDSSKEKAKIDSLQNLIVIRETRIAELLDSAEHIKNVVVVKEIEKIKELPITKNVEALKENLLAYGELTEEADTLPVTVLSGKDTVAVLSENNIADVNIIVARYEGELAVNERLEEVIENGYVVLSQKDSIIDLQSTIIVNQDASYATQLKGLEKSLRSEKVKKTVWVSILGGIATILGVIAIAK